jgi:hypothetical protein
MTMNIPTSSSTIDSIYDSTDKEYLEDFIGESSWCNDDECSCHQLANYARERLGELRTDE